MMRKKIETNELLPPQKLETLFIDVSNKKFLLNGKTFGKKCKAVSIVCYPDEWKIKVIIDQPVEFTASYTKSGENAKLSVDEIIR